MIGQWFSDWNDLLPTCLLSDDFDFAFVQVHRFPRTIGAVPKPQSRVIAHQQHRSPFGVLRVSSGGMKLFQFVCSEAAASAWVLVNKFDMLCRAKLKRP